MSSARVTAGDYSAAIERGIVALVGVERGDGATDVEYIARKIRELRMFDAPDDSSRESNTSFALTVQDIGGAVLVVSQFTLAADCRKGRRPSFDDAAPPEIAKPLFDAVVVELRRAGIDVQTGRFQATMQVALVNDGPVTLMLDSRKRF